MHSLRTLYGYELKKIWKRKIVRITLLVCLAAVFISVTGPAMGSHYVDNEKADSKYHIFLLDREYNRQLNGREIDQTLLEEMSDAYGRIPSSAERYTLTEEYQKYARPYNAIFSFVGDMTDMTISETRQWIPDLQDLYARRMAMLEAHWTSENLSEGEKEFWRQKEAALKTPFVYQNADGYYRLFSAVPTMGLLALLSISICLAGVFAEEHARKTDQLILCSARGKSAAYWAKILAGASFSAGISLLLMTLGLLLTYALYGSEGAGAMFQLIFARYSCSLTVGQSVLIVYGCMIATSVIFSIMVMLLSEMLRSSIAALAVTSGMLMLSMVCSIPYQYRIFAQIWDLLPSAFLTPWNIFDVRLISVFGHHFTAWQAVPVLYLLAGGIIAAAGKPIYRRFQVSGR